MKKIFTFSLLVLLSTISFAQINYKGSFGKGLNFKTEDGSFGLKVGVRVQPRWDYVYIEGTKAFEQQAWVARGRLKFDGFMVNPDLRYKIEFDVVGGYIRDAMVKYRFAKHSDLWFGQGKLPGNRERVVSSGNLQFVNRSITNNAYNIDRDVGIQFHHFFEVGNKMIIRDMYALSTGNGIRNKRFKPKPSLTAKIEILPMGWFEGKGDYVSGDLKREQTLKMAIAFSADYNMDSYKSHSHIGAILDGTRDLLTLNADILFKYKGWSLMSELGMRSAENGDAIVYDDNNVASEAYYTGWGVNTQTGYLFKNNWEVAVRYAFTNPDDLIDNNETRFDYYEKQTDHTLCVSKYIVGHKLKVQADINYRDREYSNNLVQGRLQMEVHF
ncbi:MAG: porin [Salibacteraceae bacterium]